MQNKLTVLLDSSKQNLLNIYVTAGYPGLKDTPKIILESQKAGVDLMEIGIPFSDPLADGPVIQESSQKALDNGMTLELLIQQLNELKEEVQIPLLLMGYYNSILQFGLKRFCEKCAEARISGLIIPDLPLEIYQHEFKTLTNEFQLHNILLVTPQTSEERIREIDKNSTAFIYAVSSASTTGSKEGISDSGSFLKKLGQMNLKNSILAGFNINNRDSYMQACKFTRGAIIGSAFIKALANNNSLEKNIATFINSILSNDNSTNR